MAGLCEGEVLGRLGAGGVESGAGLADSGGGEGGGREDIFPDYEADFCGEEEQEREGGVRWF